MSEYGDDWILFENEGEIDLRAITTFGISAKLNDNPIGFFGTGLKYALSILVRTGHEVELHVGTSRHTFGKKTVDMRGKEFEVITMDGEELPFATHLGTNWQVWQAFREMYCNCLDEKGTVSIGNSAAWGRPGKTVFAVKGREFMEAYYQRNEIVLRLPKELLLVDGEVQVYNRPSKYIYYRGVRVWEHTKESMFTYNATMQCDLTEDRTLKYPGIVQYRLELAVARMKDKGAIRRALFADDTAEEHSFSFGLVAHYESEVSQEFWEVVADAHARNEDGINRHAIDYFVKRMRKQSLKSYNEIQLTQVQRDQLARAVKICTMVFDDFGDYKVMVVGDLGQSTMALADSKINTMVLSKQCFVKGTKYLVSTMIEEYIHLKTGLDDCSRSMQNYLVDMIGDLIEAHLLKEPI